MKKTYFAPEIEAVKVNVISMICGSREDLHNSEGYEGSQASKEYNGDLFLWDDTAGE